MWLALIAGVIIYILIAVLLGAYGMIAYISLAALSARSSLGWGWLVIILLAAVWPVTLTGVACIALAKLVFRL